MIETTSLTKQYGPFTAVHELSLTVPAGQIVGLLGPNGAGKTTTIRMIAGYLPPTAGSATVAGHDVITDSHAARASIGYLPENNPLYPEMRVDEYLDYRGRLLQMPRTDRRSRADIVVDRCGLSQVRRRTIGRLSKGNRQRVGLAAALLHEPQVLILDEPTSGLDPNQIGEVRKLIAELRDKHTVIVSSHILPEIEKTVDRVVIIAAGKIAADGPPTELRESIAGKGDLIVEIKANADLTTPVTQKINAIPGVTQAQSVQAPTDSGWTQLRITTAPKQDPRNAIAELLATDGHPVREFRLDAPSLEQFFIEITAKQSQTTDAV